MAKRPFLPLPGIVTTETEYSQEGRWVDGDRVRFVGRFPQPIGGWTKARGGQFLGKGRGLLAWRDGVGRLRIGLGTHRKVYAWYAGTFVDITPLQKTGQLSDPFATTAGDRTVTVTHVSHGLSRGTFVHFEDASDVGGLSLNGEHEVIAVIDSDHYTIRHAEAATSTASGGGTVSYGYEIAPGNEHQIATRGYGVGLYGVGLYGTPRETALLLNARTWHLDVFGQELVLLPRDGNLYVWSPMIDERARAVLVSEAPTNNRGMFVTDQQSIVLLGADGNPLLVHWSDFADRATWTPAADNQSGKQEVRGGSGLIAGGRLSEGVNLLWTDHDVYVMRFVPSDVVYEIHEVGSHAGLIGPLAATATPSGMFWMGRDNFFMFDGAVRFVPNQDDVRTQVFRDLNRDQRDKIVAGYNPVFNEVWWFWPDRDSLEPNRATFFSLDHGRWSVARFDDVPRTSWHAGEVGLPPIALGADGHMYRHEEGTDADGEPLRSRIRSGPVDIGDGDAQLDINAIIPDFHQLKGRVDLTLYSREYPNSREYIDGPFPVRDVTPITDIRASGRQVSLEISQAEVGGFWRLGRTRLDVTPGSRR